MSCKDCKHWGLGKPRVNCRMRPKRVCQMLSENLAYPDPDLVIYEQEAGLGGSRFWTAPDFGCLLEEK